jgi:shikimate kinase
MLCSPTNPRYPLAWFHDCAHALTRFHVPIVQGHVISCGGGVVESPTNVQLLKAHPRVLYIQVAYSARAQYTHG